MSDPKYLDATVLIVDDTVKNIQVLGSILRAEGMQVSVAQNGQDALSIAKKFPPDLILLDIMMPDMDGFEVCEALKADDITANVPVIFLTARVEPDDIIKGLNLGAVDYVVKPFNATELLVRVRNHLDLALANKRLSVQNEERLELLHILCHDLSNSFSAILGFLSVEDQEMLENWALFKPLMTSSAQNAADLIELVRKMRAIDEGKLAIELSPKPLLQMVEKSLELLQHQFKGKKIQIEVKVEEELEVMVEEISFVNSVLNNILTNAIKFSYPHSLIQIISHLVHDEIQLTVKDRGIGMTKTQIEHVFDLSKSTTRLGTEGEIGTGFGLPLVKKFVTKYGGRIMIESHRDKTTGTEVTICLRSSHLRA